jgi:hypothetical protein
VSEPHQHHSNLLGYTVVAVSTGVANLLSYTQSFSAGAFATGITIVGGGVVGFVVLWLQKVGPAWVDYKTYRDMKRDGTLAGKLDKLTEVLGTEREGKELARQLAKDARDLAEVNRRRMEKSDQRAAELMDELKVMAKRLEDANRKLHEISSPMQTLVGHAKLAEQQQDEVIKRLDHALGVAHVTDDKATHISQTVDTLAGLPDADRPPYDGVERSSTG